MDPPRFDAWLFFWVLGIAMGMIGIPALLGFLGGSWLEQSGARTVPWRLVFVAVGVGLGGLATWRLIGRPSSR
jgi:hypothetical protein